MPTTFKDPALLIGVALYGFVALLFLRDDGLRGLYRTAFALAVFPVFLGLSLACIWLADSLFPDLLTWLSTFNREGSYYKSWVERSVAFLVASVVPFGVCCAWYSAFRRLSQ